MANQAFLLPAQPREKQFARYLSRHKLTWLYAPRTFTFGQPRENYTPDFYLPDSNTFCEVIGSRQALASQRKKYARFVMAYPTIKWKLFTPTGAIIPYRIEANRVVTQTPIHHRWTTVRAARRGGNGLRTVVATPATARAIQILAARRGLHIYEMLEEIWTTWKNMGNAHGR